tara:strand:- start:30 stop:356 length:327 start_codon:yes stop_codon:yes gene_type:complete
MFDTSCRHSIISLAYLSSSLTDIILTDMNDLITSALIPWIDQQRRSAGIPQHKLARALGCAQSRISQLLSGEGAMSLAQYAALADAIGFDAAEGLQLLSPDRRGNGRA